MNKAAQCIIEDKCGNTFAIAVIVLFFLDVGINMCILNYWKEKKMLVNRKNILYCVLVKQRRAAGHL